MARSKIHFASVPCVLRAVHSSEGVVRTQSLPQSLVIAPTGNCVQIICQADEDNRACTLRGIGNVIKVSLFQQALLTAQ
eukprot:4780261-Amphidinium_carterae.3